VVSRQRMKCTSNGWSTGTQTCAAAPPSHISTPARQGQVQQSHPLPPPPHMTASGSAQLLQEPTQLSLWDHSWGRVRRHPSHLQRAHHSTPCSWAQARSGGLLLCLIRPECENLRSSQMLAMVGLLPCSLHLVLALHLRPLLPPLPPQQRMSSSAMALVLQAAHTRTGLSLPVLLCSRHHSLDRPHLQNSLSSNSKGMVAGAPTAYMGPP
jgi:hypothetical protein